MEQDRALQVTSQVRQTHNVIGLSHTTKEFLPNHGQVLTQPITSFRDDVISHYDDVIPECYATNIPYKRTCITSTEQTSRGTEDRQGSQGQAEKLTTRRELRARLEATFSRSKATGNREEATTETRDHRQQKINKLVLEQQQLPLYSLLHY